VTRGRVAAYTFAVLMAAALGAGAGEAPPARFAVSGFRIEGPNPLGKDTARRLLEPHASPSATLEDVRAAASTLEAALRARGSGFMRVSLPRQRLDGGGVVLQIVPITVSDVNVRGARYLTQKEAQAVLPALAAGADPEHLGAVAQPGGGQPLPAFGRCGSQVAGTVRPARKGRQVLPRTARSALMRGRG